MSQLQYFSVDTASVVKEMMMSAVQHHVASIIESAVWFKPLPNPPFTLYLLS
jgi:hypothetical protein